MSFQLIFKNTFLREDNFFIPYLGNIETRSNNPLFRSRNVVLRLELDLFVNLLHCKSQPGIKTKHNNIDIILIRQNTEGEYSCLEHESVSGVVESVKVVTREKSEEIVLFAFDYALVSNPHQFDVLLLPNPYGNILNNNACGLVGGPGIISGQNIGHEYAVFETVSICN
ncbi:hypothetical protein AVEN_204133-2 [Araneus ventricosus]|uniref:Isopropylmalate dehydrogenase-like domain-containing protein n=1 Tax=Araneus ventricosus TaxID=182803 RepID=A0A4Y2T093_ARAVE|nr:hypothetical protein AVEN_204133-2 [Araneus ventricosus]